jgi:O-antigen/teichoic acid export membrane protein
MLVPMNTIQTGISNFTSKFKINNEYGKIKYLFVRSTKKLIRISFIAWILFLLISKPLSIFLNIPLKAVLVTSLFLVVAFLLPVVRGLLQGLQKFGAFSFNLVTEGVVKFFGGILLVLVGFGVNGAIGSMILAYLIAYLVGMYLFKKLIKVNEEKFDTKEVYAYALPILVMLISLTLFYSIDMVIVKHFFNNVDAGYYSALSLLGKVVFFGSVSITQVMFPKISESCAGNDNKHKKILFQSLGLVIIFSTAVVLMYLMFPQLVVNILYGKAYLSITPLVWLFGLFMGLFSIVYALAFYHVAMNKTKFVYLLFLFNIIEVALLWMFHDSLLQVITTLCYLMGVLLVVLLISALAGGKSVKSINNNPGL